LVGAEKPAMQPGTHQSRPASTPGAPLPSGEAYRLSLAPGGRLQGTFDLTSLADAEDMIRAITLWKTLLKPLDQVKKPDDEAAN
jgi:hypothetical protein